MVSNSNSEIECSEVLDEMDYLEDTGMTQG